MNLTTLKAVFTWIARKLLDIFGKAVVQKVVLDELEKFAKRTDTTVDDRLVRMARLALANEDYLEGNDSELTPSDSDQDTKKDGK